MSKSNFDKHVREHKFRVLQKGGNGRKVFVAYESLSDALRSIVEEKLPDAKEQLKKQQLPPMDERLKSDSKAVEFFRTYTPAISYDKQVEYVLNAKVLNAMVAQEKSMTARHNANGFNHKKWVRDTVVELCEKLRECHEHSLPQSRPRLLEKYKAYKEEGYQVLVNGNSGNQAARKIGPKEGRLLIKLKRSVFPVYTDMQIFKEYNRQAEEKGWKTIESPQTVINYLYKTAVKLCGMVPFMARLPSRTNSCHSSIPSCPRCPIPCGMVTVRSSTSTTRHTMPRTSVWWHAPSTCTR